MIDSSPSRSDKPRTGGVGDPPQPLRVLVVEDSENDFLLLISILRRGGFAPEARRIETEGGLREALEESDWEIVIADYRLPEFNAPAALAIVKHYCPDTPFIVVSGLMQEDLAAVSILSGAHDALHKEKLVRLPAVIRRELKSARLRARQHSALMAAEASRDAVKDSEARFLLLTQHLPECFWLYDVAERKTVYVNEAYTRMTGRPIENLMHNPRDIVEAMHETDVRRLSAAMERARFGGIDDDFRIKAWDGKTRWVHLRTFSIRDKEGVVRSVGGIMSDITDMVTQQHELQRMAHFDMLTGLPNRLLFKERLSASLAMTKRNGWQLGLLFVDLDRFKVINDTLGHAVGDELLRHAAKRLRMVVRESDTVSRMGGDEFAIILPDLPSVDDAASVSRKLIDAMAQPFFLAGQDLFVSASIGITLFPDDSEDVDALIRNADAAMYRAKDAGRNTYEFYRAEMNLRARELLSLEIDLRQALVRREFELHYQPKVSLTTGTMLGVEALIRWNSPQRGLVSPMDFIPLLEETGLIVAVGAWVLQEACRQTAVWHAAGYAHLSVAVNLSGRQVSDTELVVTVREALANTGLPARALELELTESMLMRDAPAVESLLDELRQMGVALSVDDFGTGYSSLAYLKRFPLDTLKVDRSFVRDITADPDDASITRAVIQMSHELSLKVVAEGVETAAQLQLLAACGCDQIQGYYFSRPLAAAALTELLAEDRMIDASLLRHRADLVGVALLGADDEPMCALADLLVNGGMRVDRFATASQLSEWLVDHGCDVLVGTLADGGVAEFSAFAEASPDPRRAVVLLAGADAWNALHGVHPLDYDAVLPWPSAPGVVMSSIIRVVEHHRLRGELERLAHDNRQLDSRLQKNIDNATLPSGPSVASVAGAGLASGLANALRHTDVALIGVDSEGWIVFANESGEQLLTPNGVLIGCRAGEVLPEVLLAADGTLESRPAEITLSLAHRSWRVNVLPLEGSEARGGLLVMAPEPSAGAAR